MIGHRFLSKEGVWIGSELGGGRFGAEKRLDGQEVASCWACPPAKLRGSGHRPNAGVMRSETTHRLGVE